MWILLNYDFKYLVVENVSYHLKNTFFIKWGTTEYKQKV